MTYFLESIELMELIEKVLSKEKKIIHISKILAVTFNIIGLCFAVYESVYDGYEYQVGIFIMGMALFLSFFMIIIPKMGFNVYKQRKRTITLGKDDIQLKNWKNELERSISYETIQYVEVVPLLGVTYFRPHGGPAAFKKMYFICLHISRCKIREGDYACNYVFNKNVIRFPYEASAWDILSQHISAEKMKSLADALPMERVKWNNF